MLEKTSLSMMAPHSRSKVYIATIINTIVMNRCYLLKNESESRIKKGHLMRQFVGKIVLPSYVPLRQVP